MTDIKKLAQELLRFGTPESRGDWLYFHSLVKRNASAIVEALEQAEQEEEQLLADMDAYYNAAIHSEMGQYWEDQENG